MKTKKTALVLSGGGANGAFQAGAISALRKLGISFDVVAGNSVGSLNGILVAQDDIDTMVDIWMNVTEKDVYIKKNIFQILWRLLVKKKKSVYDAEPLYRMIQKYVSLDKVVMNYYMGFTSLVDGEYHVLSNKDFYSNRGFHDAIYASSLMPILWEPVKQIHTLKGTYLESVDGGLHDVTPLSAVLKESPDHIYIITCNKGIINGEIPTSIIDVVKRTFLDIMLTEVVRNDIEGLLRINDLVLQAKDKGFELSNPKTGEPYKYFEVTMIEPPYKLGSPIDFSHDKNMENFALGKNIVEELYKL